MSNKLEGMVRRVARTLKDRQRAKLWKVPNDLRITKSGLLTYGDQTPVDFIGHTITGRAVLIECKDIVRPSLDMKNALKPHQWIALKECHDAGGVAILIWSRRDIAQVAAIDVDVIDLAVRGRKSIPWKMIPPGYVAPFCEAGLLELLEKHQV